MAFDDRLLISSRVSGKLVSGHQHRMALDSANFLVVRLSGVMNIS